MDFAEIEGSDDEDIPLTDDRGDRKSSQAKNWDVFQTLPPDADTDLVEDQTCYIAVIKCMKVVAYIVTFIVVLGSAILAKGTTLLMTSQLNKTRSINYCNKNYGMDREFTALSSQEERISWYWAILFVFMVPETLACLRSLRVWIFKGQDTPSWLEFLFPFLFETLHTIGLSMLVYTVLPSMDVIKGLMITNCMCLIPGILGMLSRSYEKNWTLKCCLDVLAILSQISALFIWPLFSSQTTDAKPWLLPISAILISFGWWENFVEVTSPFEVIRKLANMKQNLVYSRYVTYSFITIWKMAVFLGGMSVCFWSIEGSIEPLYNNFSLAFERHTFIVQETRPPVTSGSQPDNSTVLKPGSFEENSSFRAVQVAMIVQMLAAYFCYIIGKFACKICIQGFSFSFPVLLTVPITTAIMVSLCGMRSDDVCFMNSIFPGYLYWTCPTGDFFEDFFVKEYAWVWIFWLLSQTWITLHIWNPTTERLAKSERLFLTPYYNAILIDQSLALNRRKDNEHFANEEEESEYAGATSMGQDSVYAEVDTQPGATDIRKQDTVPHIIACATMWHEERDEMIQMLKSVFRMDADQCARRVALTYFEVVDPGYYEYETHIFFDDAFQRGENGEAVINSYVRTFLGTLEEAAASVHQSFVKLRAPKKIPTPYGGRLEYVLPGKTKLVCHIKDKNKIRHRKRWSQVMYMYYLLGHKLMDTDISVDRKDAIAENTFLLALDGDVDFQPNAVELLVDLMKKNSNLGAACGRIHPTGTGPMVWYQKFEYATGHWLQKATEHMIGCVLCSPGCFSLFRGKALMDDNIMARYTLMSEEPRHYVQYDQGEDRWLCTLLLQRGYRVEYSAASDAKTHAPEGFNEFYNQRRRWVPSTMANIFDLLMDYKKTVKANPDISMPYIGYQLFLMVGSILGPGTIFLMLVGAFVAAFKISNWTSFQYNAIPIVFFIIICYFCKADIQLTVAQILSAIYGLVMVAVLVAIALQIAEDGLYAPSSIFLVVVAGSFIIAGIVHPLEFGCLPHGFIYYITIPSMYLLLIIYSLFNMNVVSWGTREGPKTQTDAEIKAEKEAAEAAKNTKKKGMFFGLLPNQKKDENDTEGSFELSFAGLFKLMCCVTKTPNDDKQQLKRIADAMDKVSKRLDEMERAFDIPGASVGGRRGSVLSGHSFKNSNLPMGPLAEESGDNSSEDHVTPPVVRMKRDDLMNPFWIEDKDLKRGEVDFLTGAEIIFWKGLIEKYLKPIDADKKKEDQLAKDLIDLRNKSVAAFFMINAIFVILIFLLQLEKETIHIDWPFGAKSNVSYVPGSDELFVSIEYLELEPIGLIFVGFFGVILIIQFIAMLFHRFGTLSHILAATEINFFTKDTEKISNESTVARHGVGLIRRLQKLKISEEDGGTTATPGHKDVAGRRKTLHNLEKQKNVKKQVDNLERQFKRNYKLAQETERRNTMFSGKKSNVAFQALQQRRSTVLGRRSSVIERRKSFQAEQMDANGNRRDSTTPSTSSSGFHSSNRR